MDTIDQLQAAAHAPSHLDSFAYRCRFARERTGLSQVRVSELVGVSTQAVWNYENRPDGSISVEYLFPLADALQVNARWLATGEGAMRDGDMATAADRKVEHIARHLAALREDTLQALSVLLGIRL